MTEPPLEGTPPAIGPAAVEAGATPLSSFEAVEPVADLAPQHGSLVPAAEAIAPATAFGPTFKAEKAGTFTMPGGGEATLSALPLKDAVPNYVSNYSVEEDSSFSKGAGLSGSLPRLFDASLFGGLWAALPSAVAKAMTNGAQENRAPLLPFGFPDGTPVGGSTLGSSGFGIGLDLLAALALLALLSRAGGSSRSYHDHFKLVSSPRLVTELPG